MGNTNIRVVPGPANYFSHPGSLARLDDFFTRNSFPARCGSTASGLSRAHALICRRVLTQRGQNICCLRAIAASVTSSHLVNASGVEASVVIGVGGGAVMDTVKAVARRLGVPFVGIPTIAATCAAWTLSVWYNDAGQALRLRFLTTPTIWCWWSRKSSLTPPAEYLLAGIGDTLAKWYEAAVLAPEPENLPLTVRLGLNGALAIRDVLLERSEEALADQQRGDHAGVPGRVDAVIAGGGMVGGLGERYTRVAAARAVHNGLTVLPQTEKYLHGTKVAYGILVQSALLGQDDVLAQLVAAYQQSADHASRTGRRYSQPATSWIRSLPTPCAGGVDSLSAGDVNA